MRPAPEQVPLPKHLDELAGEAAQGSNSKTNRRQERTSGSRVFQERQFLGTDGEPEAWFAGQATDLELTSVAEGQ